jgi:hypothetical protein
VKKKGGKQEEQRNPSVEHKVVAVVVVAKGDGYAYKGRVMLYVREGERE